MALGTSNTKIVEGDLVKVIASQSGKEGAVIPLGTIARIVDVLPGEVASCQLEGYEPAYVKLPDLELVCYTRKRE